MSLHAAAVDTLIGDESDHAIAIISPQLQLCWVTLLCAAGAWLRMVTARRSTLVRLGVLGGLVLLDVLLATFLAAQLALLVDTLHHIAALGICYYVASRIAPAYPAPV